MTLLDGEHLEQLELGEERDPAAFLLVCDQGVSRDRRQVLEGEWAALGYCTLEPDMSGLDRDRLSEEHGSSAVALIETVDVEAELRDEAELRLQDVRAYDVPSPIVERDQVEELWHEGWDREVTWIPDQHLLFVPVSDADAPAWLGVGGYNEAPTPSVISAVLRRWRDVFGTSVVYVAADSVVVRSPRLTIDQATALLREAGTICGDLYANGELDEVLDKLICGYPTLQLWWD